MDRLAFPPPLALVKKLIDEVKCLEGMPQTALPRRAAIDRALFNPQQKLETALNVIVAMQEKSADPALSEDLTSLAALVRSAFEDLQENRRRLMAGRQSHLLDQREDRQEVRLLTPTEEAKLREHQSRGKGKGKGWGKGKGKGKGRQGYGYAHVPTQPPTTTVVQRQEGRTAAPFKKPAYRSRSGPPK